MPTKLVDLGYDVWMADSRGTRYSNKHVKDDGRDEGWQNLKERWDFSWADMGQYDVPAFID